MKETLLNEYNRPKIIVINPDDHNLEVEVLMYNSNYQSHFEYWKEYFEGHPEIDIDINKLERNQIAMELAVKDKIVMMDITSYKDNTLISKENGYSTLITIPLSPTDEQLYYLSLLNRIFNNSTFVSIGYNITKTNDIYRYKAKSRLGKNANIIVDEFIENYNLSSAKRKFLMPNLDEQKKATY